MAKVIYETNMKELPVTCVKCKFSEIIYPENTTFISDVSRKCYLKGKEIPKIYNKKKRNWTYERPKWCPLKVREN